MKIKIYIALLKKIYILKFIQKKNYIYIILNLNYLFSSRGIGDWGWGMGDWGLGIGDWGLGPIPNPPSPIPNPQSPFTII